MQITITPEQYVELLQASIALGEIKKANAEHEGREAVGEFAGRDLLLALAPDAGLDEVDANSPEGTWLDVINAQTYEMLDMYVGTGFWERLAWELAGAIYERIAAGAPVSKEEKYLAVTNITNNLLKEFEKHGLSRVQAPEDVLKINE